MTQETQSAKLLFSEVVACLLSQKKGGNCLIKAFDCHTLVTAKIVYFLYGLYDDVCVCKLRTSRPCNGEVYIVCKRFNGLPHKMGETLMKMVVNEGYLRHEGAFEFDLPSDFVHGLTAFNDARCAEQISQINATLECRAVDRSVRRDSAVEFCKRYKLN